jgi:hypothetical protein
LLVALYQSLSFKLQPTTIYFEIIGQVNTIFHKLEYFKYLISKQSNASDLISKNGKEMNIRSAFRVFRNSGNVSEDFADYVNRLLRRESDDVMTDLVKFINHQASLQSIPLKE